MNRLETGSMELEGEMVEGLGLVKIEVRGYDSELSRPVVANLVMGLANARETFTAWLEIVERLEEMQR